MSMFFCVRCEHYHDDEDQVLELPLTCGWCAADVDCGMETIRITPPSD